MEPEEEKVTTPDKSKDDQTPTKSRRDKGKGGSESKREARKASAGKRTRRGSAMISPPPGQAVTPVSEAEGR